MRKIVLATAIAGAALSLTACSDQTQQAASETAEGALADTQTNLDSAGEAIEGAADDAGAAIDNAAHDADHAVNNAADDAERAGTAAEADLQGQSTEAAAKD